MSTHPVRLPDHILEQARIAANEDGITVGQMIASLVSQGLDQRRSLEALRVRAARADVGAALAILNRVPDVPAEKDDEPRPVSGRP